ncbi:MAG: PIN domain-containing protein [Acidimicrobiales bacterium]
MATLVIDTDVASLLQRHTLPDDEARALVGATLIVSFVTVGELMKWAEVRSWGHRRREELGRWLDPIPVLPGDRVVAATWARLVAASLARGRPRPVNDTWIAACCVAHDLPLVTLNRRDFEDFSRHDGLILRP